MTRVQTILSSLVAALLSSSVALAADSDYKAGMDAHGKLHYAQSAQALTRYIDGKPADKSKLAIAYWVRAHDRCDARDWKGAIQDCTESIALNPDDPQPYHFRATALLMLGKNQEGLADIDRSLARHPNESAHLLGMRAMVMLNDKKDAKQAIEDATKAIAQYPEYGDAYEIRANAYEHIQKFEQALDDWNKLAKLDPKRALVPPHISTCLIQLKRMSMSEFDAIKNTKQNANGSLSYQMGVVLFNEGKVLKALPLFDETLKINPKFTDAHLFRGICYKFMGKYETALRELNLFLSFNPKYVDAYYMRAQTLIAMHRVSAAFADFNKLESMDPNYVNTYEGRGTLYTKLGDYDKAMAEFQKGLAIDPHNGPVHLAMAQLYEDEMQDEKAIAEYREVLKYDKKNQGALIRLHRMVRENAMSRDAEKTANALSKSDSPTGYTFDEAGKTMQSMGKFDKAIEQYNKALEQVPTSYLVHWHRAQCYMKTKQFEAALKDWNAVVLARPQSVDAIRRRGECYLELKKPAEALKDLNKAISMAPNIADLYEQRSNAYAQLGKRDLGQADFEHAMALREKSAHDLDKDIFPPKKH